MSTDSNRIVADYMKWRIVTVGNFETEEYFFEQFGDSDSGTYRPMHTLGTFMTVWQKMGISKISIYPNGYPFVKTVLHVEKSQGDSLEFVGKSHEDSVNTSAERATINAIEGLVE